jgi:hypothetical protein
MGLVQDANIVRTVGAELRLASWGFPWWGSIRNVLSLTAGIGLRDKLRVRAIYFKNCLMCRYDLPGFVERRLTFVFGSVDQGLCLSQPVQFGGGEVRGAVIARLHELPLSSV